MRNSTLTEELDNACKHCPDQVWLRDRKGDVFTEWTWTEAQREINVAAAWLEKRYGASSSNIVLLSRNRAHWIMADLAITASGNVTIPMFTTLPPATADYVFNFTGAKAIIVGESSNWDALQDVLPNSIDIIALPGVDIEQEHKNWADIVAASTDAKPEFVAKPDDLISIVFTSGTTGVPKGVMQSHNSMLLPMKRCQNELDLGDQPRFLSYLPLSHIAERQLIIVQSLLHRGSVTFNESLETLPRDMADTRPTYFFGAPRVWEQLQQGVLAKFGSQEALDAALAQDREGTGLKIRTLLGLNDAIYLLTAAAPTPPALIHWFESLGLNVMEGFGQTEIMATTMNMKEARKIGSIGRLGPGVDIKISDEGEILFKAAGAALGYYKMPEKTAETFIDGWVHTGDKGYMDEDGYVYLTGRVKDYFKTVQGKFVAPPPIENQFSENPWTEQLCLLGRGYSKTAMVCVLSARAQQQDAKVIENALIEQTNRINAVIEKHARIGAVIITTELWTIENAFLTPTLKLRRDEVEAKFGDRARQLAYDSAVGREIKVEWFT